MARVSLLEAKSANHNIVLLTRVYLERESKVFELELAESQSRDCFGGIIAWERRALIG